LPHLLCVIYTYGLPLARRYSLIFSNRFSKGAGIFDAETYISTQPAQAFEEARVPDSHEDEERGRSAVAPPSQGTQARLGETGFPRIVFPRKSVASCQLQEKQGRVLATVSCNWEQQDGEQVSADARKRSVEQGAVTASFPRAARLLKHSDFERVYKQGRRQFSSHMTVFYLRQAVGVSPVSALPEADLPKNARVGFTVGRALGGAVVRNRIKRRLREAVRLRRTALQGAGAVDVVINPKKSVLTVEFSVVVDEVGRALDAITKKLGER
jgi:ribonuclease P protein component